VIESAMESDSRIVCITPSTLYATGFSKIFQRFTSRSFDPGMAEQHAMGLACGLALGGTIPVIAFQSTFMQRAFDQLLHDVCFHNAAVLILCTRSGFSGYDGPTHHGIYDLSYLQCIPNLRVVSPKDAFELERMVAGELRSLSGPTMVLMPYGSISRLDATVMHEAEYKFRQPQILFSGTDITTISVGTRFASCHAATLHLRDAGVSAGLINLRYIKPLLVDALIRAVQGCGRVVIVEEAVISGSVGSELAAQLVMGKWKGDVQLVGLLPKFVEAGSIAELEHRYCLDVYGLIHKLYEYWPELVRGPSKE
jgi:1-deoxy-D-xylulose-5-phosphate synthase